MKNKIIAGLVFMAALFSADTLSGQRIRVPAELGFETWLDNREYKSESSIDQTMFGARLTPIVGLQWLRNNSINIGGDFRAEFGAKSFSIDPEFIVYYNYDSDRFKAYAGVFPRGKVMGDYPLAFFSDSVRHYDSNLDGVLLQYMGGVGYVELACDWLSMLSGKQREKFVVFSSGRIMPDMYTKKPLKLFAGYYASMFHHSVSEEEDGVVDNMLAYPYLGLSYYANEYNEKNYYGFMIKAGWIQAFQRDRKFENKFVSPGGVQIETEFRWRKLGVNNTLYIGDDLMPYYERYGNGLYQGDPLYRTQGDVFDRIELFWAPVIRSDMKLRVSWVQVYDGKKWGCQQLVTLSINLNKNSLKNHY